MFYLGCHLSFSKGYEHMAFEAASINANTLQFFTRSPRGGKAKPLNLDDLKKFNLKAQEFGINHVLAHAPYTLNPCSDKAYVREYAEEVMRDDLHRMSYIPNSLYNFHPGSHVGQGRDLAIPMIIDHLNRIITPQQNTIVLLETMAGKGSEVGWRFEELQTIIQGIQHKDKIGVCLDTCHIYDAGYDIVNNLDTVLNEFDHVIGLDKLYAIHLNDSKNPFNSHKDRHEKIGHGTLGIETFERIINHPKLAHLPFYLETPNEVSGYKEEIALLRSLRKNTT